MEKISKKNQITKAILTLNLLYLHHIKKLITMRGYVIIFAFLVLCQSGVSQLFRSEKRIYLLDVTASMCGKGNIQTENIFLKVKEGLLQAIEQIENETTEIVFIPYTNKAFSKSVFSSKNKTDIVKYINDLKIRPGDTNIVSAWEAGLSELNPTKVNYLFLLTDGLHNTGVSESVLYDNIRNWPNLVQGFYYFAFYVMLTPNAKEKQIESVIDSSKQIWKVESMNVNVSFIQSELNLVANVNANKSVVVPLFSNNPEIFNDNIDFSIELEDNPYYELKEITMKNKSLSFIVKEKVDRINIPIEKKLKLYFKYNQEKNPLLFFTPDEVDFTILNRGIRKLTIIEIK